MAGCRARGRFRSCSASIISVRSHAVSAISRWPMTRCRDPIPTTRRAPRAPPSRCAAAGAGHRRLCGSRSPAVIFRPTFSPKRSKPSPASPAALGATRTIEIPEAARARAAAYVITTAEGASLHLDRLRKRPDDFDPAVRDRLLAGAMIPAPLVDRAQKFRRWYRAQVLEIFKSVDVIIAPATPCVAPKFGQATFVLDGVELPVRANIGIHTQPISFIGLPVVRCRSRSSRCRSACRSSPHPGGKISRCAWLTRWSAPAWPPRRHRGDCRRCEVDLPDVLAEVTAQFARYEKALVSNDVAVLDELFRADARTLRYGIAENLYGHDAITAFRAARSPVGLMRRTAKTVITSYGRDTAVASTLFYRDSAPGRVGRQMQTWVRFAEGWKIVAAHVSIIDEPRDQKT